MWRKEVEEGAEEVPPTPEEAEEGPPALSSLDKDASLEGGPAWGTLRSSTNPAVKHQVLHRLAVMQAASAWQDRMLCYDGIVLAQQHV